MHDHARSLVSDEIVLSKQAPESVDLATLLASFNPEHDLERSKLPRPKCHTILGLKNGIARLSKAISGVSLVKLDRVLTEIDQEIDSKTHIPTNSQKYQLSLFVKLLATNRYFNEIVLRRPSDPGLLSIDPLFRRTQELSELVAVLRKIQCGSGAKADRTGMRHALKEAHRLCVQLDRLSTDVKIEPAFVLKQFEDHATALLKHPVLTRNLVSIDELGEFRKHIRRLTLFTRLNLLTGDSDYISELHQRLQGLGQMIKLCVPRVRSSGGPIVHETVAIGAALKNEATTLIQDALRVIPSVRVLSANGAPYAGLNHRIYLGLLQSFLEKHPDRDEGIREVEHAYNLAKTAHHGVYRMGGLERYFDHARGVSIILMLEAVISDPDVHSAALIHDVKEDTAVLGNGYIFGDEASREDAYVLLSKLYNPRVAEAVLCVTKRQKTGDVELDRKNMRLYLEGLDQGGDVALLVKMADRLYNLRTLPADNPEFCLRQLRETISEYLPIFARYLERAAPEYSQGAYKMYDLILEALAIASSSFPEHVDELWGKKDGDAA